MKTCIDCRGPVNLWDYNGRCGECNRKFTKGVMQIELNEKWKKHCAEKGETGMGYQFAHVKLAEDRLLDAMIYNGTIMETKEPIVLDDIREIDIVERMPGEPQPKW